LHVPVALLANFLPQVQLFVPIVLLVNTRVQVDKELALTVLLANFHRERAPLPARVVLLDLLRHWRVAAAALHARQVNIKMQ